LSCFDRYWHCTDIRTDYTMLRRIKRYLLPKSDTCGRAYASSSASEYDVQYACTNATSSIKAHVIKGVNVLSTHARLSQEEHSNKMFFIDFIRKTGFVHCIFLLISISDNLLTNSINKKFHSFLYLL